MFPCDPAANDRRLFIPIMVSIGEDALKAVPDSYREAAFAMGATRWQTVYKVLIPAAKNGLLAAVLLGVGRAIGETMAVLMATGHAINNPFVKEGAVNFGFMFESVRTITATIAADRSLRTQTVRSPALELARAQWLTRYAAAKHIVAATLCPERLVPEPGRGV